MRGAGVVSGLCLVGTLAACGDMPREAPPTAALDAGPPVAVTTTSDASVPSATGAPSPSCHVLLEGGVSLASSGETVSAMLESAAQGNTVADYLALGCTFEQRGVVYQFEPDLVGVTGPGTYVSPMVLLNRDCQSTSCPGDFDFYAYAPSATCVFTVDTFSPQTRGGMSAHFACPGLVIDDFEDPGDPTTVAVTGSFDLPPVGPITPDGGPSGITSGVPDAGPPSCTIQATGGYDSPSAAGTGYAVGDAIDCTAGQDGVVYSLVLPADAQSAQSAGYANLTVSGDSWCDSVCTATYVPSVACTVTILVDNGVNGHFAASFECAALSVPGVPGGGGLTKIVGKVDGIRKPVPPPQ